VWDLIYGGVIVVAWFHKKLAQVTKSYMGYSLTVTQDVCVCVWLIHPLLGTFRKWDH
jgi:hypothetical protein